MCFDTTTLQPSFAALADRLRRANIARTQLAHPDLNLQLDLRAALLQPHPGAASISAPWFLGYVRGPSVPLICVRLPLERRVTDLVLTCLSQWRVSPAAI